MIFYIFKVAILSIFIILLTHHIIHYSTTILTPTKIKDYVNVPEKHYKNITELLKSQSQSQSEPNASSIVSTNITNIPSSSSNISSFPSSNQIHCPTEEELMIELSEYMDTIL